jgi:hypothetical protein
MAGTTHSAEQTCRLINAMGPISEKESIPSIRTAAPDPRSLSSMGWARILTLFGTRCFPRGVEWSTEMWRDSEGQVGSGTRTGVGITAVSAGPPPNRSFQTTVLTATG